MVGILNFENIKHKFESSNYTTPKFKTGDRVAYKTSPDICIGSISPDSFIGSFDGLYYIFTSSAWFDNFAVYGGPNTICEHEENLILYINKHDTD